MQVMLKNDRMEQPEECDGCQASDVPLTRYYSYGPGHQVVWHCEFCEVFLNPGTEINHNLANLGHVLLRAIHDKP